MVNLDRSWYPSVSTYQLKAHERNIVLKPEIPGALPAVFADISLTERVFQNLLDNAFKFTPDGGQISISLPSPTRASLPA